ncbi:MAG: tetratricopeptide repeat protein [Muribaculaceae bacterium]|nr:tetratricopeptide repeat protein [Muribaculaceae bacterium]
MKRLSLTYSLLRLVACLGLLLSGSPAHAQINTDQVLNIGRNALYFEDYILSIQYFNQVIAAKPYLAEPYFFRAVAKINLEDYRGAEEDASLCIERNPFITDAYQVRGVARQNQRKFKEAVQDYDKGLSQLPENKVFLLNKAICETELKNYAVADSTYAVLTRLDSKNDRAHLGMAQLLLATGDTTRALEEVNKSLEITKNSTMAYAMRAEINLKANNDYEAAVKDLDEVIKLEPHYAGNFINRAFLRYKLDDYYGAMSDYDYAVSLEPDNAIAIYNRAQLNAEVGEDLKAIDDFSRVLKLEPNNFLALYNRAQLYLRTQQFKKAVKDYDRILNKYPNFESGYMARAQAKQQSGDLRGSERDMQQAIAIFKKKGIRVATYNPAEQEAQKMEKEAEERAQRAADGIEEELTEEDIMKKFNSLLTVENDNSLKPEYENRSRGRIQNSNVEIDPQPMFLLSYYNEVNKLNGKTHYMKEITEVNESSLLPKMLVIANDEMQLSADEITERFTSIEYYNGLITTATPRAIDYFARAIDFMMVKNPAAALADADRTIALSKDFALAYFLRADAHYLLYRLAQKGVANDEMPVLDERDKEAAAMLHGREQNEILSKIIDDLNEVLKRSPKNVYATYNKGCVYLLLNDYTSAINCFSTCIEIKPDLGEAYYNRGLTYLRLGNRERGVADLSKAGELGILPSYNVLKRINR